MKLFIMRHAQASFNAPSDRERPITEKGIEQTKRLISENKSSLADVNLIWSSELLRARQTAELVSECLNLNSTQKDFLSPDDDVRQVVHELKKLDDDICLLIVSHQPLVGELVSYLVNANVHQAHPYATSEVMALEMEYLEPGMASLLKQYLPI